MERGPVSGALKTGWLLVFAFALVGGFFAIAVLGAACEDYGSAGSDAYCRRGGMETAMSVILGAVVWAILVPMAGLLFRSRRTFLIGLVAPVLAIPLDLLLVAEFGTG